MRLSLRLKVALGFSTLMVTLLALLAVGVSFFAEAHEEQLISALIQDDMTNVLQSYRAAPETTPPFDARLHGYVSPANLPPLLLPENIAPLPDGTHEIIVGGREIHVAIVPFNGRRLYRVYNFSAYEKQFKAGVDALMIALGVFAILAIWLSFGLSGLLMRQVAHLAKQVNLLRNETVSSIDTRHFDEIELVGLVDAFNEYHRRMAGMISREKDFTGNVSHELRTPLTVIKTSSELLEQAGQLDDRSRERVAQIMHAADHMHESVNALLLLAREPTSADTRPVQLARLVRGVLAPFGDHLIAKHIATTVHIAASTEVMVHEAALRIVLSNLVDNAARYTASGAVSVIWSDGVLSIADTGRGIAPEALPHIFERYYRDQETAPEVHGHGIGLAIVRKLCDQYDWPISIDSKTGVGTRVSICLPAT